MSALFSRLAGPLPRAGVRVIAGGRVRPTYGEPAPRPESAPIGTRRRDVGSRPRWTGWRIPRRRWGR